MKYLSKIILTLNVLLIFSTWVFSQNTVILGENLNEVVITGTMKKIRRSESPVPVEIISSELFKKNPTSSIVESLYMINGVRPQINCGVCYTTDIRINGIEGSYTMVLIDGMPIVSALSTVYGLSAIPNSMIEQVEVVKGPASSLYGAEAMAGIINIVTKNIEKAPRLSLNLRTSQWLEHTVDISSKFKIKKVSSLLSVNYFNYKNRIDNNKDNFMDVPLQNRVSVFNKWNFERLDKSRIASLALRYINENRTGGIMQWQESDRGSSDIYGESIYTSRIEVISRYQLPFKERIISQFSYNYHDQNSVYGNTPYLATQKVAFGQVYWDKDLSKHNNLLLGASFRYNEYDDNTPVTASPKGKTNAPSYTSTSGFFLQDEMKFNNGKILLLGYRYGYNGSYGNVHSPRIAYKFSLSDRQTIRTSFGTGFRVVNLFSENHAALSGSREIVIKEKLNPERSYGGNLNYTYNFFTKFANISIDCTGFYTNFTNKIIADYDADPNKIIFDNIDGNAVSQGVSLNTNLTFTFPLKVSLGASYMDVFKHPHSAKKERIWFAPEWSGTFLVSYSLTHDLDVNLSGNWNGPMRLPIYPNDFRPEYSPWFTIANLNFNQKFHNGFEISGGIKNLFDFIPNNPILRPNDPFDKTISDTKNNPKSYTFDTTYVYTSLQGIRGYIGVNYQL